MWEDKDETIRILENMLYEACDLVFEKGLVSDISEFGPEINSWYDRQRPVVLKREAKEIEVAKAKLTDREKKLLGVK